MTGTAPASDETGLRVGKSNSWLWVFHHVDSAVFIAAPRRVLSRNWLEFEGGVISRMSNPDSAHQRRGRLRYGTE